MAMRWLFVSWLVIVALGMDARAEAPYSCYTIKTTLRPEPQTRCAQDCEAERESEKQLSPIELSACTPATTSVWCMYGIGNYEQCFADRNVCIGSSPSNTIAKATKKPMREDVCTEKGKIAPAPTTPTASPPDGGSVDEEPAREPDDDGNPHHYMVYGGLLAAGEEPDNSTAVAFGLEHRRVGSGLVSYAVGVDAVGHYDSGPRGFGGRVALRAGVGGSWGTGSAGLTVGYAYGGVERSASEIPFELFVNGSILGVGVLLRYEQVHRFVDNAPMTDARFMNASGFSAWLVVWGKALDPKLSLGIRMQSRDDTDAAFFHAAWGVALP